MFENDGHFFIIKQADLEKYNVECYYLCRYCRLGSSVIIKVSKEEFEFMIENNWSKILKCDKCGEFSKIHYTRNKIESIFFRYENKENRRR